MATVGSAISLYHSSPSSSLFRTFFRSTFPSLVPPLHPVRQSPLTPETPKERCSPPIHTTSGNKHAGSLPNLEHPPTHHHHRISNTLTRKLGNPRPLGKSSLQLATPKHPPLSPQTQKQNTGKEQSDHISKCLLFSPSTTPRIYGGWRVHEYVYK